MAVIMKAATKRWLGHIPGIDEAAKTKRLQFPKSWDHIEQGYRNYDSSVV